MLPQYVYSVCQFKLYHFFFTALGEQEAQGAREDRVADFEIERRAEEAGRALQQGEEQDEG